MRNYKNFVRSAFLFAAAAFLSDISEYPNFEYFCRVIMSLQMMGVAALVWQLTGIFWHNSYVAAAINQVIYESTFDNRASQQ